MIGGGAGAVGAHGTAMLGARKLLWFWLIRCGVCCNVALLEVISGALVLGASWCPDVKYTQLAVWCMTFGR